MNQQTQSHTRPSSSDRTSSSLGESSFSRISAYLGEFTTATQLASQSRDVLINLEKELLNRRLEHVIQWVQLDPKVEGICRELLDGPNPRLQFKIIPSLKALGARSDGDDCALAVFDSPIPGKLRYELFYEPKLFVSLAHAVVAFHHEFHHMIRDEAGQTFRDFNREEREVYLASTTALRKLIGKAEEIVVQHVPTDPFAQKFVEELRKGFQADKVALRNFQRAI